ncbi:MAG: hypothetical protein P9X26_00860 [Candidatus Stygibacter frigidus]|nr:hypothetical protein [Candidatus Stygibacter frigidus]
MNKLIVLLLTIIILAGCTVSTEPIDPLSGEIPLSMDMRPVTELGFTVTQVQVTISIGTYQSTRNLEITGSTATGIFSNLTPGIYDIYVEIFEEELLIATGRGSAEVIAGEVTEVEISVVLEDITGKIVINVDWTDLLPPEPHHILFLGNSYTAANGGLYTHLTGIAQAIDPDWEITTGYSTPGGCTLEMHTTNTNSLAEINSGLYDYVVLQEQSTRPVENPNLFYEYASVLDSMITANGGETAFFMTWARQDDPAMIDDLAAAYTYIGTELQAPVSPVGLAFEQTTLTHPEINLYSVDGSHPSWHGSYLTALVIYATLWDISPIGCSYIPDESIHSEDAFILQEVAWEVVSGD